MKTVEEQMEQEIGKWPGDLDYTLRYTDWESGSIC